MVRATKSDDVSPNQQEDIEGAMTDIWAVMDKYVNTGKLAPCVFAGVMETSKQMMLNDTVVQPQRRGMKFICTQCRTVRFSADVDCPKCGGSEVYT